MRIFLQEHGDNVRSAGGGLLTHDETATQTNHGGTDDGGEHEVVGHVDDAATKFRGIEGVEGGGIGIGQEREAVHDDGGDERGENGARAELRAEENGGEYEQGDVKEIAKSADLDGGENIVKHNACAVDAAGHDVVGVDEKDEASAHDDDADQNIDPRRPPRKMTGGFTPSFESLAEGASRNRRSTRCFFDHGELRVRGCER